MRQKQWADGLYLCGACESYCTPDEFTKGELRRKQYRKRETKVNGTFRTCRSCQRKARIAKMYGLAPDEYEAILAKQEYRCPLCDRPRSWFRDEFVVDHCHRTGMIRGLLCYGCNIMLHDGKKGALASDAPPVERYKRYPPAYLAVGKRYINGY